MHTIFKQNPGKIITTWLSDLREGCGVGVLVAELVEVEDAPLRLVGGAL